MKARFFSQAFALPLRSRNSRRRRLPHQSNPANQQPATSKPGSKFDDLGAPKLKSWESFMSTPSYLWGALHTTEGSCTLFVRVPRRPPVDVPFYLTCSPRMTEGTRVDKVNPCTFGHPCTTRKEEVWRNLAVAKK